MIVQHRRHWIPPWALIFAQAGHGASWLLLGFSGVTIAWIHTAALGWITIAALGILIHVIPGFTGIEWRRDAIPRYALVPFGAGIVLFVAGWLLEPRFIGAGGLLLFLSAATYFVAAVAALRRARRLPSPAPAIARALTINLSFFFVACALGAMMSVAISYGVFARLLSVLPPMHAALALFGWLTMLVYGVSARTMRPICGARSRWWWMHVAVASSVLAGPILMAGGIAAGSPLVQRLAAAILVAGAAGYAVDTLDIVRRAIVPHRPPQAFVAASVLWLVIALLLGIGAMAGRPFAQAFVFVLLVGWIGQMVNAHFLHIGVRLIATAVRGDDDETQPAALLDGRLSWASVMLAQAAIAVALGGLLVGTTAVIATGAALGFLGWCGMVMNAAIAMRRARRMPIVIALRPLGGR